MEQKTKICPNCGTTVGESANSCMKCGFNLAEYEASLHASLTCPQCGASLEEGDLFCSECGCRISDKAKETDMKNPENDTLSSLEKELNLLVEVQEEEEEKEYNADIKKARDYCNSGRFAEAGKIYERLVLTYPEDMNGYMGLLRVASENYTIPEGENVVKALRIARRGGQEGGLERVRSRLPYLRKAHTRKNPGKQKKRGEAEKTPILKTV